MGSSRTRAPLVVAVDLSTTACKAIVFGPDGSIAASARVPIASSTPRPGWQEQDPADWWRATREALARVASAVDPAQLRALAVTHQRETFVCLDRDGVPVRPAILWLDTRARAQAEAVGSAEIHEITGRPPSSTPTFYKLLWLQEHEPDVLPRTDMVADVHAFLVHELTGRWVTSWASADPTGLVDVRAFRYAPSLLATAGLDEGRLPALVAPGRVIGEITPHAAEATGLPPGLPVVAGAGDGHCAGLGAAVCAPGQVYLNLGTAVTLGVHSDHHLTGLAFRTLSSPIAGRWTLEAALASGVHSVEWFRAAILRDHSAAALERIEAEAADVPVGAGGLLFLPYLVRAETPHWDPAARGAWVGLRDHHGLGHLYRALLEGIAYEQRAVLELIERDTATATTRLRLMGGGANSRLWVQLIADIFEHEVEVTEHRETTALGAAALAAAGVGVEGQTDVAETARRMSQGWRAVAPVPTDAPRYRRRFEAYRQLYPALAAIFRQLED
jgi:sugar (pentulose or hexulose) kinase